MTVGRTSSDHRRLGLESGGSQTSRRRRRRRRRSGHRGAGSCEEGKSFLSSLDIVIIHAHKAVTTYVCPTVVTLIVIFELAVLLFWIVVRLCWICMFLHLRINGRDCLDVMLLQTLLSIEKIGPGQKQEEFFVDSNITLDTHHCTGRVGCRGMALALLDHFSSLEIWRLKWCYWHC